MFASIVTLCSRAATATEVSQSELFALGKAHEKLNAVISKIDANPTNEKLMTEYDKVSGEVGDSSSTKVLLSPFIGLAPGMSFTNTKGKNETNPIKLKEAFDVNDLLNPTLFELSGT